MKIKSPITRNAVRATLAIVIALIVAHFTPMRRNYWIPMTTIVLMQMSLGASIKKSKKRVTGTILGVLVGVMLAVLLQHHLNIMLATLPIFILFIIYTLPFSYAIAIFLISTLLIMLLAYKSPYPWHFAFTRLIDTIISVGITLIVSIFFFPSWAKQSFYTSLIKGIKENQNYFNEIMEDLLGQNKSADNAIDRIIQIEETLTTSRARLDDYTHEPQSMVIADGSAYAIIISEERIHSILASLQIIRNRYKKKSIDRKIKKPMQNFFTATKEFANKIAEAIENRSELPDFGKLSDFFYEIKNSIEDSRNELKEIASLRLLYHNLFAYISELKHIVQATKQLRHNC